MLHRIKMDDESSSDASSLLSSDSSTVPSSEFDRLDLNSRPSMSTVFSSSEDGNSSQPTSPTTPTRSGSSSNLSSIFHRRKSSHSSSDLQRKKKDQEDHLCRWLQAGNVIYKSVGLGLMDLTVGMKVVEFAKEKGIGTHVETF